MQLELPASIPAIMKEIVEAYNDDRGRTAPVPLSSTSLTLAPAPNAYTKPLMLLVDEVTVSGGDMFAAIIQDNQRGPLLGIRTMGAGGSVVQYDCTTFTESLCTITESLMTCSGFLGGVFAFREALFGGIHDGKPSSPLASSSKTIQNQSGPSHCAGVRGVH